MLFDSRRWAVIYSGSLKNKSQEKENKDGGIEWERQIWGPAGFRFVGFGLSCCLQCLSCPLESGLLPREAAAAKQHQNRRTSWVTERRWREGTKEGQKGKQELSRKATTECRDKDVLSVILTASVYPVKVWKDCCLSSILSSDIQNPISGFVGGGFLSDSGPFVRPAINEEHWQR